MHGELPVFKRCCFCVPLRYGLITWGYLKLVAGCFFILEMFYALYLLTIHMSGIAGEIDLRFEYSSSEFVAISISLLVFVTDFVLTTVFIVGGHKKQVKLLRVFYFYAIVVLVLTFLVIGVSTGLCIVAVSPRPLQLILLDSSAYCASIALQTYFLLLLRSEIIKLRNNCEFRFVNNATEAECTMKCDEEKADGETNIEDV